MPLTVLVVDDDSEIVCLLQLALEDEGYRVVTAVDGEALAIAHDIRPDVILLDIMMPGMDGVEVCRRLREDPVTAGIPIVAMSAHGTLLNKGGAMPADDKLPKPFELDQLYVKVERWATAKQ